MTKRIKNIEQIDFERQGDWHYKDLSGERLGVRIEETPPGSSSSIHHYHTLEEEHVIVLEGSATLVLGSDEYTLTKGDHIWFPAGEEVAHHIENRTDEPFRFLVFGERITGDVVVYPNDDVMLVKAPAGMRRYRYRPHERDQ